MRRIGVLIQTRESDPVAQASIASFQLEPRRLGWLEGRNVRIDVRKAAVTGFTLLEAGKLVDLWVAFAV
jgi:hypothetical protein